MIRRKTFNKVLYYFNGDVARATMWFKIPNPELDGLKPEAYSEMGKHQYLDKMIDLALDAID